MKYKIEFDELQWQEPELGIRLKSFENENQQVRLIELSKGFSHPEWCEKGHVGYVLEGELEIEFESRIESYACGDVIFIPEGAEHKHRPSCKGDMVTFLSTEAT